MTSFYFVRHGVVVSDEANKKIYQNWGSNMLTLSDEGVKIIKQTAKDERLKKAQIIITSPFGRAIHSAAILSKELNIDMVVETDVHEWVGDINYKYLDDDEIMNALKEYFANKGEKPADAKYDYETVQNIKNRVEEVLKKYNNYTDVIVVSHGVVIQAFLGIKYPDNGEINEYKM